jgi:hypothetical protein
MAAPKSKHIDGKKRDRKGYFLKDEEGMPDRDYTETCTRGFKGGGYNAHHIIPQTALKRSANELKRPKKRYITDVQYITDWNINNTNNMIGLPHFRSYLFYYQYNADQIDEENPKLKKDGEIAKIKRYINTFNKWTKETREGWLEDFTKRGNPETYPIHLPVSWGHTDYNVEVKTKIKTQIWEPLDEKQKEHELDAQKVTKLLNDLSNHYYRKLRNRKDAIRKNWNKRYDQKKNPDWYKPFTMVNIDASPLG